MILFVARLRDFFPMYLSALLHAFTIYGGYEAWTPTRASSPLNFIWAAPFKVINLRGSAFVHLFIYFRFVHHTLVFQESSPV